MKRSKGKYEERARNQEGWQAGKKEKDTMGEGTGTV